MHKSRLGNDISLITFNIRDSPSKTVAQLALIAVVMFGFEAENVEEWRRRHIRERCAETHPSRGNVLYILTRKVLIHTAKCSYQATSPPGCIHKLIISIKCG